MPVYFFHVRHGDQLGVDAAGLKLPNVAAVRRRAVELAREIMSDALLGGELALDCRIEVANQAGVRLLVLPFTKAVAIRPLRRSDMRRFKQRPRRSEPMPAHRRRASRRLR